MSEPIERYIRGSNTIEHADTIVDNLGPLQNLMGTWFSPVYSLQGYNVMPLPQEGAKNQHDQLTNIILKNFHYYETMTFTPIGKVPNRGGTYEQDCFTLLYEQRVFFADGPAKGKLVHAENGSWLHLVTGPQTLGPYGPGVLPSPPAPDPIPPQDPATNIVKQVSVPHGNSLLATGSFYVRDGAPEIPNVSALPVGADPAVLALYGKDQPDNLNINPNHVLQQALHHTPPHNPIRKTTTLQVSSKSIGSSVGNIPFIVNHANVSLFETSFWIEERRDGSLQLQYSQKIDLEFPAVQGRGIVFPHVTANTMYKAASLP